MTDRKTAAALDAALKASFKKLEDRGVPEHVMRVVEQLEDKEESKPSPAPRPSPGP
ncbi:hypothetical protein [Phenylobacterium sp.]|uniref:hypothetical protein n=1 Tax=Phenylobacterium sp. TaxID=1871053 RepID=UPI0025FED5A5|nr:hypothetical protein [Phenylobacterium sp.]MBX3483113.1 hypothetical protein [Phenylobacterium sp.]MCW5760564.1 hypothetical protein [Phenylobacterium sp.]